MGSELGTWVARDDFIAYVERYAAALDAEIKFGVAVQRIDRDHGRWRLTTSRGPMLAPAVIVATGLNRVPRWPSWPGREQYRRELIHACEYVNADRYRGRDVLVVGPGASGMDIAVELAKRGAARVRVSVRTPPLILRRAKSGPFLSLLLKYLPIPGWLLDPVSLWLHRMLWGDLSRYGLPRPTEGLATSLASRGHGLTIDRGLIAAVRQGRIEVVPAVRRFHEASVELIDGTRVDPDAVIAATGQRPGLEGLVGHLPGVLSPLGLPSKHGAKALPHAPDLHFLGFRIPPGQLPDLSIDARAIARRMARRPSRSPVWATYARARINARSPERVARGVWLIRGGLPLRTMNVYLIEDQGQVTVFDAGIRPMARSITTFAARLGGIRRVLLSHSHVDHRGAAPKLGAPVYCHEAERADAEGDGGLHYMDFSKFDPHARLAYPYLARLWDGGPVSVAGTVAEGDVIAGFEVIALPGHAPGQVGLWRESDRVVLCSDCIYTLDVQTGRKIAPRVSHPAFNFDDEQARSSVRKLAALRPRLVCPGHGDPLVDLSSQLEQGADQT